MKSEVLTVGDVCESVSQTYRGIDEYVVTVNTSDVLDGVLLNHEKVKNSNLKGQFKKSFQKDDILYSEIRPANKRCALIKFEDTACYVASTKLMVLRAKQDVVLPEYLYAFLTSQPVLAELQHLAETRSGTFPQITFSSELAPLSILCPPLATQRKIAAVLSSLDDKIETNNAICRNLETVGGFMLQHYIEQCSTHVKLSSLMGVENGYAFKSKEYSATGAYKVVTIKNVLDGRVDAMDASGMDEIPADMRHGCRLAVGDVLVSLTGNVGRVGIVTQDKLLLNQRVAKIVPKKKSLLPFLYFYFRNETFKARLEALARGTAQPNLSTTETLALEITTDEKGAEKLSSSLTPLIWQIITRFQENERLSTLRDTLLPRLMRGELDVSAVNLR